MDSVAIRAEKLNRYATLVIWLVLLSFAIPTILYVGTHKTIVITESAQESADEHAYVEQEKIHSLLLFEDAAGTKTLKLPLEKNIKAEHVALENHYAEQELRIYLQGATPSFYDEHYISGDLEPVLEGNLEDHEESVTLQFLFDNVYEFRSVLENNVLTITFARPKELYEQVVVINPLGRDAFESATTAAVAAAVQKRSLHDNIKLYVVSMNQEAASAESEAARAVELQADLYIALELSESEDIKRYGIESTYNSEYVIPDFGNAALADILTKNVTVAAGNKALGLKKSEEDGILMELAVPSAIVSLGYSSNEKEKYLLGQDAYVEKLAQGIADTIMEVYTITHEN